MAQQNIHKTIYSDGNYFTRFTCLFSGDILSAHGAPGSTPLLGLFEL